MSGQNPTASKNTWNNRWTFILAAAGSAIGLGNIWKFPYIAGQYGGGAFVLMYMLFIVLIGVPLLMAETAIGRSTRLSPLNAMRKLTSDLGISRAWNGIAWMGMLTGFVILTFYSVIAGWSLSYAFELLTGHFAGMSPAEVGSEFDGLVMSASRQTFWHTVFMGITIFVTARGIHKGLEKGLQVMMPTLFLLLIVMLGYSMFATGEFMRGFHFMFDFNLSNLTGKAVVAAMGQAFFTLSLGMCALMAYGAYMPANNSIPRTALNVAFLDTLMAIISGLIVFPIVYAHGMEPSAGPGLLFVSLTSAFASMSGGSLVGFIFFVLVGIAALSSAISLLEPSLAWVTERFSMSRAAATILIGGLVWFVGLANVLSFNHWAEVKILGRGFFDLFADATDLILLPLGGATTAIFVGWVMKRSVLANELSMDAGMFNLWRALIRVVVPVSVLVVLVSALI